MTTLLQIAKIAEVSVRTLHHYDAIDLLNPKRNPKNEYRTYDEKIFSRSSRSSFQRIGLPSRGY